MCTRCPSPPDTSGGFAKARPPGEEESAGSIRGLVRDGSGDVTGEHARAVRDSRPHIGGRELPLTVLVLLLIGLLWVRKTKLCRPIPRSVLGHEVQLPTGDTLLDTVFDRRPPRGGVVA
jgi:hypothetical protein